ncbi:Rieske 2Fe-2S domain-containing protein [Paracoccaceae bacterium]|nr:Rieske 2Fe-2S domain-containing protein [Paracoccaceae bacterium]
MKKISRRHVIITLSSTVTFLCPAVLNAATSKDLSSWANIPTDRPIGLSQILQLSSGPASIDISGLKPGDVTVIARPDDSADYAGTGQTQFVAVMRKNKEYLVVELTCPHKGKAIGLTGDPKVPFACTKRGRYHSSEFDSNGLGVAGKSSGDLMIIPEHKLTNSNGKVVLELA